MQYSPCWINNFNFPSEFSAIENSQGQLTAGADADDLNAAFQNHENAMLGVALFQENFTGRHVQLAGAFGNPKPIQRPHPPILIGGRSSRLLRIVAEQADMWNVPGDDIDDAGDRSALLDRYCAEVGRDPAQVTRSIYLQVDYDQPDLTRDAIGRAIDAGFGHLVLGLPNPYPDGVAQWVVDELITTTG